MEDLLDKPEISIIEDDTTTQSSLISVVNTEPLVQTAPQSNTGTLLHVWT